MTWSPAWQQVQCKKCKRRYKCTPYQDYYNSTNALNGLCEACLISGAGLDPAKTVTIVIDEGQDGE